MQGWWEWWRFGQGDAEMGMNRVILGWEIESICEGKGEGEGEGKGEAKGEDEDIYYWY